MGGEQGRVSRGGDRARVTSTKTTTSTLLSSSSSRQLTSMGQRVGGSEVDTTVVTSNMKGGMLQRGFSDIVNTQLGFIKVFSLANF